ncbi:MAG: glycosyltransferase family 2 protein [Halobacteriota archaeon]
MRNKPRVSAIIVNWNRRDDLKECIQSVLNQTCNGVELIVVDNNSTDGSGEMINDEYSEVKLISLPDSSYGACEAFNIGFSNARGEFCLVLDNDVSLQTNWIELALNEFESDPQLGCVAGRVINYYTGDDWGFWNYGLDDTWQQREFLTSNFSGCSALIRKDVLDTVGDYPKEYFLYWNELALSAEIINAGFKIKYVPRLIAHHKVSPTQRPGRRSYYYSIRNGYWYFWTYYPLKLAVKHTFIHFFFSFFALLQTDPLVLVKSHADAFMGLPTALKKRKPVTDSQVFRPIKL